MSYFFDQASNLALYEAPKNGGTTLRLWLAFKLTGNLYLSDPSASYYTGTTEMTNLLLKSGYCHRPFKPSGCQYSICIKRDPIDRFVSCFQDKIIKEGGLDISVTEFLDQYESIIDADTTIIELYSMSKLSFHFQPQTYHFGADLNSYDRVFRVDEINTGLKSYLEDKWQLSLPPLHARNAGSPSKAIDLSESDKQRIRDLYSMDYRHGWF